MTRLLGAEPDTRRFSMSATVGLVFLSLVAGAIAMAQPNMQTHNPDFSIRVVDETVGAGTVRGPAGEDRMRLAYAGKGEPAELWLKRAGQIGGDGLARASAGTDADGKSVIEFRLTAKGAGEFATITRDNIGHRLAIVVNGKVITAPVVQTAILGGQGQISGDFATQAEAKALVAEMMGTNHPNR